MSAESVAVPAPPEPSDSDIIADVLAGDRRQFAVLVRRHNQPVFRACRAVLRDDQEAEDAVQTAWLNAYRALATFRRDASFRTWMTRIAVNEASTRLRDRRRHAALVEDGPPVNAGPSPDHQAIASELSRVLERELDALPEGLRAVLVLRDVIELDTAETAGCLGIQDENVRVRLHRARTTLAHRMHASMQELLDASLPDVWRFDGDRCARTLDGVLAAIERM
ncbi:MAG TPA: RNA polymerase sigma factor [Kofleriaceae bacterium]|nr:RNA polymerase sigma factor [Kofleriaceae bacterium]